MQFSCLHSVRPHSVPAHRNDLFKCGCTTANVAPFHVGLECTPVKDCTQSALMFASLACWYNAPISPGVSCFAPIYTLRMLACLLCAPAAFWQLEHSCLSSVGTLRIACSCVCFVLCYVVQQQGRSWSSPARCCWGPCITALTLGLIKAAYRDSQVC